MKNWKLLDSKMAFDHRWFKVRQDVVQLPNGKILDDYFVWVLEDVSLVVPVTVEGKFVLVEQYKHGIGKVVLEFPAGLLNKDEDPEEGALRELKEETGYTSEKLTRLTTVTNDATKTTSKVHIYLAEHCVKNMEVDFDENEDIDTVLMDKVELLENVTSGTLMVSASVIGALMALRLMENN